MKDAVITVRTSITLKPGTRQKACLCVYDIKIKNPVTYILDRIEPAAALEYNSTKVRSFRLMLR